MEKREIHFWSESEKSYLAGIVEGHSYSEILQMMNENFSYQFKLQQIKGAIGRYGLNTGRTGRFEKGHEPFNKNLKGMHYSPKTEFQKGHMPENHKEIGSERIDKNGYVMIKVAEPNKWRIKQRVIYERENGEIPRGCIVIFKDGDKTNFDIENLEVITRAQHVRMNQNHRYKQDAQLTEIGLSITNIEQKIRERLKNE